MHFVHFADVIGCNNMLMLKVCKSLQKFLRVECSVGRECSLPPGVGFENFLIFDIKMVGFFVHSGGIIYRLDA